MEVEGEEGPDCSPMDVPSILDLGSRRLLLDLESACRIARNASEEAAKQDVPLLDMVRELWAAVRLHAAGLHVTAIALEESAASRLVGLWPAGWPVSAALSLHAAWLAQREYRQAFHPAFADCPQFLADTFGYFPAFLPFTVPAEWVRKALRTPSKSKGLRLTAPRN